MPPRLLRRPQRNPLGDKLNAHGFPATPDYLAGSLGGSGDERDAKSASDLGKNLGRYPRAGLRDIEDLAFAIPTFALNRDPCRLTPTPAYRLAPYPELFARSDHRAFMPQID